MKALYFLCLTLVLVMMSSGCGDRRAELFSTQFEVRIDIPGPLEGIVTHGVNLEDIVNTFELAASQNGYSLEDISTVNPSVAVLENVFGLDNFSNISRVRVFMSNEDRSIKREIFFQETINLNHEGPLQLFGSLSDVKPMLEDELYHLNFEINFRTTTNSFLENRLVYNFVSYGNE